MLHKLHKINLFIENHHKAIALALLLWLLCMGLLYSSLLGDALRFADERHYHTIAENMIANGLYSLNGEDVTAFRPPVWPTFIAIFKYFDTNVFLLRLVSYFLYALTLLVLYNLLLRLYNPTTAIVAIVIASFYPFFFYTAGTFYPQTLAALLFLLLLYLATVGHFSFVKALLFGLVGGLLALTVPPFFVISGLIVFWLIYHVLRKDGVAPKRLINPVLAGSIIVFIVLAWSYRNYVVFDDFIMISSNLGINLLLGNSIHSGMDTGVMVDLSAYKAGTAQLNEAQLNRHYTNAALSYITANPVEAASKYVLKVLNYFNYSNNLATASERNFWKTVLGFISYMPLLVAFFLRIYFYKSKKTTKFECLCIFLYIFNAFFMALFFTRIRFRLPFDYLLISVVSIWLVRMMREVSHRRQASLIQTNNTLTVGSLAKQEI